MTDIVASRATMVVTPHPDDESFGCGATIARVRDAGTQVTVVAVTDGRHSSRSQILSADELGALRSRELRDAVGALHVPDEDIVELGVEDGTATKALADVVQHIQRLLTDRRPQQLFIPSALDSHPDHRAVHAAALTAARAVHFSGPVFAFPVWAWSEGPLITAVERPTRAGRIARACALMLRRPYIVDQGGFRSAKRAALSAYASQTTNLTGERNWAFLGPNFVDLFLSGAEVFEPIAVHGDKSAR